MSTATLPLRSTLLVTAEQLAAELQHDPELVLLDVRYRLDRPDGREDYATGHIPGAVYVSLDDELAEHGAAADGRHPLPSIERLRAAATRWGLSSQSRVVVYDDMQHWAACRAWWLLRYAGFAEARVLDGGLRAWNAAQLPLETGAITPMLGSPQLQFGALPALTIDQAAELGTTGQLLDARAPERYRGETEPLDPKAGHIPGARNAPVGSLFDATGCFRSADELRAQFAALGLSERPVTGVYCGSGVSATPLVLALTLAGFNPALYPGSWSQWSNHHDRPVATGATP